MVLSEFLNDWNNVPFILELDIREQWSADMKPDPENLGWSVGQPFSEIERQLTHDLVDGLKTLVANDYPNLRIQDDSFLYTGVYGGKFRGPGVYGEANMSDFREIFGDVKRNIAITFPVPSIRIKWHEVNGLTVPENMGNLVKGVYIQRRALGGSLFQELELLPVSSQY